MKYYHHYNIYHFLFIFLLAMSIIFFSSTAASETKINTKHDKITEACAIFTEKIYSDKISAYETSYYRVSYFHSLEIHIRIQKGKIPIPKLIDSTGISLHFQKTNRNSELIIHVPENQNKDTNYLFLALKNPSSFDIKCSLWYKVTKNINIKLPENTPKATQRPSPATPPKVSPKSTKKATKKTTKHATKHPTYPTPAPTPEHIPNSIPDHVPITEHKNRKDSNIPTPETNWKELFPNPHFIHLKPKQKKKLTLSFFSYKKDKTKLINKKDFIWLNTNEKTASIKNHYIFAKEKGTAILYIRHRSNSSLRTSVLIRVY